MPPKRPPTDAMTLHELGISDPDCGLDPDGFLDGPPADQADGEVSSDAPDLLDGNDPLDLGDSQPPQRLP